MIRLKWGASSPNDYGTAELKEQSVSNWLLHDECSGFDHCDVEAVEAVKSADRNAAATSLWAGRRIPQVTSMVIATTEARLPVWLAALKPASSLPYIMSGLSLEETFDAEGYGTSISDQSVETDLMVIRGVNALTPNATVSLRKLLSHRHRFRQLTILVGDRKTILQILELEGIDGRRLILDIEEPTS
jgi:hypothetical protein